MPPPNVHTVPPTANAGGQKDFHTVPQEQTDQPGPDWPQRLNRRGNLESHLRHPSVEIQWRPILSHVDHQKKPTKSEEVASLERRIISNVC